MDQNPTNLPKKQKTSKRSLVKCEDCGKQIRSNNIKVHREAHVKKLAGIKKHKCTFESCSFSTSRKTILKRHKLVHELSHQLAKIERKKQKKCSTNVTPKDVFQDHNAVTSKQEGSTQTDVFQQEGSSQTDLFQQEVSTQTDVFEYHNAIQLVDSKIELMSQMIAIFEKKLLDAAPATFSLVYLELLKDLAPVLSQIATLIVPLHGSNWNEKSAANYSQVFDRWLKLSSNPSKLCKYIYYSYYQLTEFSEVESLEKILERKEFAISAFEEINKSMERALAYTVREKDEALSLAMVVQETANEMKVSIAGLHRQVRAQENTIAQLTYNLEKKQEQVRDLKAKLCRSKSSE